MAGRHLLIASLLALGGLAPMAARADVTVKGATGFAVASAIDIPDKTPAEVWAALIKPNLWWDGVHSWSGDAANMFLDPQAGGCWCELLPVPKDAPDGMRRGSVEHMRVLASMPPKLLRLTGAMGPLQGEALTGTLTFTLKAMDGGGTHVTLGYVVGGFMRMPVDDIAPVVDRVLSQQLARLGRYARGQSFEGAGDAGPAPEGAPVEAAPADAATPDNVAPTPKVPAPKPPARKRGKLAPLPPVEPGTRGTSDEGR
jgi:uncharacterized protein YndB with AHSA1/START domain